MDPYPPMRPELAEDLDQRRAWVFSYVDARDRHLFLSGWQPKLEFLAAVLAAGGLGPSHTYQLQSLGITFGDAMVERLGVRWVEVDDEYGLAPALELQAGTNMVAFPMTMISKRIEAGGVVDLDRLHLLADRLADRLNDTIT